MAAGNIPFSTGTTNANSKIAAGDTRLQFDPATGRFLPNATNMKLDPSSSGCYGIGNGTLASLTAGTSNICFGEDTGGDITSGESNICIGNNAGESITTGQNNIFIGGAAGATQTTTINNIGIGIQAGNAITSAQANIFVGSFTGRFATTGGSNVVVGPLAAQTLTTGIGNTLIGSAVDVGSAGLNYTIAIGTGATPTSNNQLALGSSTRALINRTTIGANGAASALTALPLGYLEVLLNGTRVQVPYYNVP